MVSPFRRHQQKIRAQMSGGTVAALAASTAPPEPKGDTEAGREYAMIRVLLHDDLRKLADVASVEARNPMKADMATAYADWVEGVLTAGEEGLAAQDEILATNMVWAIDYRDFDYALRLGAHVLKFNLTLPERYKRTAACFIAEDIATVALEQHELVTLEQLVKANALTAGADMPDQARAKLHKAIGRAYERRAEAFDPTADNAPAGGKAAYAEEALVHLQRALTLDANVGVKTDIKKVTQTLKKLAEAAAAGGQ